MEVQSTLQPDVDMLEDFLKRKDSIVEASRNGFIIELEMLATYWQCLPNPLEHGIQSIFFQNLTSSDPPTNTTAGSSGRKASEKQTKVPMSTETLRAFWSLFALSQIGRIHSFASVRSDRYGPEIVKAWPGIFKWSSFFLSSRIQIPKTRDEPQNEHYKIQSIRDMVSKAWAALAWSTLARDAICDTPGIMDFAASLWLFEDDEDEPLIEHDLLQVGSFLIGILTEGPKGFDRMESRILKAAGGDFEKIARTACIRLENAVNTVWFDVERHQLQCYMLFALFTIWARANTPNPEIHEGMVKRGATVLCIKFLLRLASTLNEKYPDGAIAEKYSTRLLVSATLFIRNSLETTRGFELVIQAFNAGLLAAFVECSPLYEELTASEYLTISELVAEITPRYLTYLKVLQAVDIAFKTLERTARFVSLRNTRAWEDFSNLAELTGERLGVLAHGKDVKKNGARCSNDLCRKTDARKNFQKCSRCQTVFYCSKECQLADWKSGHRVECKDKKDIPREDPDLSDRELHYMQALNFRVAWKTIADTRRLAAKEHPRVPLNEIIILINYDKVPPTISLATRREWDIKKPEIKHWPRTTSLVFGVAPYGEGHYKSFMTPVHDGIWPLEKLTHTIDTNDKEQIVIRNSSGNVVCDWVDRDAELRRRKYCGL